MRLQDLTVLLAPYDRDRVSREIHPRDIMYSSAARDEDYYYCGESALSVISAALLSSPTWAVRDVLDFSSGFGRVSRFLRAFFPAANLTCSEVDQEAAEWCAAQFRAKAIVTPKDVSLVCLPDKYDLIWLGSVFTHMDYQRIGVLLSILYASLKPKGVIVASFRGEKMYETYLLNSDLMVRDAQLISDYVQHGHAYQRYSGWEDDWGLSLISSRYLRALGDSLAGSRLVLHGEAIWASAHDVLAWTNYCPQTQIR